MVMIYTKLVMGSTCVLKASLWWTIICVTIFTRARRTIRKLASAVQDTRPMASGTVKWFNSTKGFGFIQPDSGGKDVFVHISAVERAGLQSLNEGQKISYEVQTERGREAAVNLKV
jgi:CspA family cold shock protein